MLTDRRRRDSPLIVSSHGYSVNICRVECTERKEKVAWQRKTMTPRLEGGPLRLSLTPRKHTNS